jgi:hypothetical protein
LEGNCGAGDDGRKGYLRRYADPPRELSLGVHPTVKALQRLKRLSRIEAMNELQRVWKHASNRAESDDPHRTRRRKKQKSNHQAKQASATIRLKSRTRRTLIFSRRLSAFLPTEIDLSG